MNERTELRNLVRQLVVDQHQSFDTRTTCQQIVFLGWFFHRVCSRRAFSEEDLLNALHDLDITPPNSFGPEEILRCPEIIEGEPIPIQVGPNKIRPLRTYRLKYLIYETLDFQYSPIYDKTKAHAGTSLEGHKLLSETPSNIPPHSCFVIQPFDDDKFDRRYKETFEPAITEAGFHSYRVDKDPSVHVPIDDIENGIKQAATCFVEITTDKPNVWFELGYARACEKHLVLVCEKNARSHLPFDIQHRSIILYDTGAPSNFQMLKADIIAKLRAIDKQIASA
jgi:hypothetical protein